MTATIAHAVIRREYVSGFTVVTIKVLHLGNEPFNLTIDIFYVLIVSMIIG